MLLWSSVQLIISEVERQGSLVRILCSLLSFFFIIMPPTSEKLSGHIGLGLSVRLSVTLWHLREPLMLES